MTTDNWKWVAEKLGIPTAFCVALCVAIYSTVSWTATNIAKPAFDRHIEFLATEQQAMRSIAGDVGKQTAHSERQTRLLEDIRTDTTQIKKDQQKFPAVAEKMP